MGNDGVISLQELNKKRNRELETTSAPYESDERLEEESLLPPSATHNVAARSIFHKASYPPRLSLNGLLIAAILATLLVAVGFLPITLPSPLNGLYNRVDWMSYTFQLPAALFIGAFLGPYMGPFALLAFIGCGLAIYPIFANGGGLAYLAEPGFGYLLGMLVVCGLVGRCFHKVFQKNDADSRSLKLLGLVTVAVLLVHAVGLLYLTGLCLAHQVGWMDWPGLALRLSAEPLAYDLLATLMLLCLVRQLRLGLWMVLY